MTVIVNYALQVCDIASNQCSKRYCSDSKTEVTIKCVTSFLWSVDYAAKHNRQARHNVMIFDDQSSNEVVDFLNRAAAKFTADNVTVTVRRIASGGIMNSIRACWQWLRDQPGDLVYQVQDDYLFLPDGIYQMIDMFMQMYRDTNQHSIIIPFNDSYHWTTGCYRYRQTPRFVIPGVNQYWLQNYDIPCTFMTSREEFNQHWDIYERFLAMDPRGTDTGDLENVTLNRILVDRNALGLMPVTSVALHMQSEGERDPYIDWRARWDAVPVI